MSQQRRLLAACAAVALGSIAVPAVAQVNGVLDPGEYQFRFATQNVGTGFGNNASELNAAYARPNPATGALRLLLTGNLEGNGNGIVLFMDTRPGGANANALPGGFQQFGSIGGARTDDWGTDTNPDTGITPTPGGGSVVSPTFNPDLALEINAGGGGANYFINVVDLQIPNWPDGNKDIFLGQNATNGPAVTQTYTRTTGPRGTVTHAFDNTNTAGVNGNTDPAGDPLSATRGIEFEFDETFLNLGAGFDEEIRLYAFITNGSGDFLSNQFLPGIGANENLGGPGGLGGVPLFDIREFPNRNSFFTVSLVPEPASVSAIGLAGTCLLARRRGSR